MPAGTDVTAPLVGSLRRPGAVLLLSCYELGHQPLGAAWPLAFLERAGFAPDAQDLSVDRLDSEKAARARFVGVSVPMHTALRIGVRVAERVRRINPRAHICLYGLYAWLNAEHLLDGAADSAIGGECEGPLVELARAIDAGRPGPVEDVRFRGSPVAGAHLRRLPFPVPDRAPLPPLERYARLERDGELRPAGCVEASRGCLHRCLHCPIPPVYGGRFFVVPRDVVLEDVRRQVRAGARHVTFGDPDFLNGPGHALGVVRAMRAEFPALTFDVTTKVEHILRHREVFPELASLGCVFVVSAVESLSDVVLGNLEKGHARADVFEALRVVRGAGIALRPSLLPFTPWSTLDDYLDVIAFVEREDLVDAVDPVQLSIRLLIPPGSLLLEREAIRPHLRGLDREHFAHRWEHPDPRMDALQREVHALAAEAARAGEDARVTFGRIREAAEGIGGVLGRRSVCEGGSRPRWHSGVVLSSGVAADGEFSLSDGGGLPHRPRAPRLTEPWFC